MHKTRNVNPKKSRARADKNRGLAAKSDRVYLGEGPPCPRCQTITTAWKHSDGWKPAPHKGHYTFWYHCLNDACLTNQIMPPEAFVKAEKPKARRSAQ